MEMASVYSSLTSRKEKILAVYRSLSPEKVLIVWLLAICSFVLLFIALLQLNSRHLISIPAQGGNVNEGIVGTPRFINPVLAISEQDQDLVNLVFAGLTKRDEKGNIILDTASQIIESDDKLHYDITINPNARFHDGTRVTADDVIYTVSLIQNPLIKSPHYVEWEGVTLEKKSDTELVISLKRPYPLFMDVMTTGILPKHVWKNLTEDQISLSDINIHAIGSGPYAITDIKSVSGIPETLTLISHPYYNLGRPHINTIMITCYPNEKYLLQAFERGDIDRIHGLTPAHILAMNVATSTIHTSLLPRTFTVFFNPNKADFLSDKKIRTALNMAINKQAIIDTILSGYGKVVETPYPFDEDQPMSVYDVEQAKQTLLKSKYSKTASSSLTITLATANTEEMKKIAEMIKDDWEVVGVHANLVVYEAADLNQTIIKDRNFQALLYGSISKSPADLYAFWHSSQRSYPGLNISNYASKKLDANLETIRESSDELDRINAYEAVKQEFADEVPGIFLFAPSLIYVTRDKVTSQLPTYSLNASSRFDLVFKWYRYTEKIWPKTYYPSAITLLENILH